MGQSVKLVKLKKITQKERVQKDHVGSNHTKINCLPEPFPY